MRLLTRFVLIAAVSVVSLQALAQVAVSGIAHVVDGDTIHLTTEAGKLVKVRLLGVAAPERHEIGGSEASHFVEKLAEGRMVRCELDGSQTKGRVVGTCFVGDAEGSKDIGAELISAGLALDCPRFSGGKYKALERPEAARLPYPSYCVPRPQKTSAVTAVTLDRLVFYDRPGESQETLEHGGGLNSCGCHFNRKTGECHCHRDYGCGCTCQSPTCTEK